MGSMTYRALALVAMGLCTASFGADDALSPEARGRVQKFLEIVTLNGEEAAADESIQYEATVMATVGGRPFVRLQNKDWSANVAGDTGEVYKFSRKALVLEEKGLSESLTRANGLSKEGAFKRFTRVAELCSQPLDLESYTIEFVDFKGEEKQEIPEAERNLDGCFWQIRRELSHKGIPCRKRALNAVVSAASGRIGVVYYFPVVVPKAEDINVTPEQAIAHVSAWLSAQPHFGESKGRYARQKEGEAGEPRLVRAYPNPFFDGSLSTAEESTIPETYYCWEVPFAYEEANHIEPHTFNAVAWVNTSDGSVIGGSTVR